MAENFDSVDRALLELLQEDASMSNVSLAERLNVSPATTLRRRQRLVATGVLERQVAIVNPWRLAEVTGQPPAFSCWVEVGLDRQDAQALQAFENLAVQQAEVQQCWRVSAGPDFVLQIQTLNMEHYQTLAQHLFTAQANVRNVKALFATRRAKFSTAVLLPAL